MEVVGQGFANCYDITDKLDNVYDVPLCPICDQPMDEVDELAIGACRVEGYPNAYCLVHYGCAKGE